MHLTAEQFEEALLNEAAHAGHLGACSQCREALAGMRSLRARLRAAHEGVHAPAELAARIRRQTVGVSQQCAGQAPPLTEPGRRVMRFPHLWRYASLAAAAMVLVVAGAAMLWPADASAAQAALVEIHRQNVQAMTHGGSNVHCGNAQEMEAFLKDKTGCSLSAPCGGGEVACCCTQKFRGRAVGCFVLKTAQGPVSLVVVPDKVETLGMGGSVRIDGRTARSSSAKGTNMLACGVGEYTYCAVGNVDQAHLADVMAQAIRTPVLPSLQ
ncbi:MAG: hypothetical protein ABFD92_05770 [Planctomycetaceae bacterium]|nr:hypothetical protein [Planctomycetaceae bacterium]